VKRSLIIAVSLLLPAAVLAQDDPLHLGVDLSQGSQIFDLAEPPPAIALLRQMGFAFRDQVLDTQFKSEMSDLLKTIPAKIPTAGGGYLLEVSTYVADSGEVRIPGGQLLAAIGPGMEPIDALAEEMLHGELRNTPPGPPYRDERSYVWLTLRNGHVVGALIPRELGKALRDDARAERQRRDRLGAWEVNAAGDLDSIKRAAFWQAMATAHAQKIADAAARDAIGNLTSQMAQAIQTFNAAYNEHLRLQREIAERDARLAVLNKIEAITSLIGSANQAQSLMSTNGKPVSTDGAASVDTSKMNTLQDAAKAALESVAHTAKEKGLEVQNLDLRLELLYKDNGVVVPGRSPVVVPEPH
jgi:hypothetical protein